jgi:hypothetical protein
MPALKTRNSLLNAPEYADRVNLIKKIKVGNGWRFAPVVPAPRAVSALYAKLAMPLFAGF